MWKNFLLNSFPRRSPTHHKRIGCLQIQRRPRRCLLQAGHHVRGSGAVHNAHDVLVRLAAGRPQRLQAGRVHLRLLISDPAHHSVVRAREVRQDSLPRRGESANRLGLRHLRKNLIQSNPTRGLELPLRPDGAAEGRDRRNVLLLVVQNSAVDSERFNSILRLHPRAEHSVDDKNRQSMRLRCVANDNLAAEENHFH